MKEEWKDIAGYEGLYMISSLGNVLSKARYRTIKGGVKIFYSERILKPHVSHKGYLRLSLCKNGDQKKGSVHKLVAIAFFGETPGKDQVNHIDGNKLNNKASNLEWVTGKENIAHAVKENLFKVSTKRRKRDE